MVRSRAPITCSTSGGPPVTAPLSVSSAITATPTASASGATGAASSAVSASAPGKAARCRPSVRQVGLPFALPRALRAGRAWCRFRSRRRRCGREPPRRCCTPPPRTRSSRGGRLTRCHNPAGAGRAPAAASRRGGVPGASAGAAKSLSTTSRLWGGFHRAEARRPSATAASRSVLRSLGVTCSSVRRAAPISVVAASATRAGAPAKMTATESPSRAPSSSRNAASRALSRRVAPPGVARMLSESSSTIATASAPKVASNARAVSRRARRAREWRARAARTTCDPRAGARVAPRSARL